MYAIKIDETGRLLYATKPIYADDECILVPSLPDGDITEYLYVNGGYVHDPLPVEVVERQPSLEDQVKELQEALEMLLSGVVE